MAEGVKGIFLDGIANGVWGEDYLNANCLHWGLDRHVLHFGDQIDISQILWGLKG